MVILEKGFMQRIVNYLEKINYQVGIRENGKEKSTVG